MRGYLTVDREISSEEANKIEKRWKYCMDNNIAPVLNNDVKFHIIPDSAAQLLSVFHIDFCAPEYHATLDEQGDRFCRMCGVLL